MDDSLYKFYDGKPQEKSQEEKYQTNLRKETSVCDYGFDYESVAESSRHSVLSQFEVSIEDFESKPETKLTGKSQSVVEEETFSPKKSNAEETFRGEHLRRKSKENVKSKISSRKLTPYPHNCDKYAMSNSKFSSRNYFSLNDFNCQSSVGQVKLRKTRDIFSNEFSSDEEVKSDYGQASSSDKTIYTDDGDNIHAAASITTSEGESRENILKNENLVQPTNTPSVKYANDSAAQTIDKSTYDKFQNDEKTRSMNTHAFPKQVSAETKTYAINKSEKSVNITPRNCKNKASVPKQLKTSAFTENGELTVIVTDDDHRNPIRENLNVKITVIHKYSRHMLEEKNKTTRRLKGNKSKESKALKAPTDRNVVENRANWPEFNTALSEEANKRYLNRLGL